MMEVHKMGHLVSDHVAADLRGSQN